MKRVLSFLILFGFWLFLSGKTDLFHLSLGIFSALLVTALSSDLQFGRQIPKGLFRSTLRFIGYLPWLAREIMVATFHVAYLALHPRMKEKIDPQIVSFKTNLKRDISKVALGTSITLTPGTITVRITDDTFLVHALTEKAAQGLPGEMERRVAWIFEEP